MADGAGAAKRGRERRLRSWVKHERLTVAMALAEQLHHSANRVERDAALRRQTTRAREGEVREEHHALRGTDATSPVMRPQEGIQRHTGVGFGLVLDPVVPQIAEQLVEVVAPVPAVFQASSSVVE